ncbi:MAG: O-antigen ligase family protein [bacterium]|nr:O-antigen ligase family protein [bacterium]
MTPPRSSAQRSLGWALSLLFFSLPFSIAGDDFSIFLLYLFGLWALAQRQTPWPKGGLNLWIPAFLFAATLAAALALNPAAGFANFRSFWHFGLPFLVALALRKEDLARHFTLLGSVTFLIGCYALVQHQTGLDVLRSPRLQAEYLQYNDTWLAVGAFSHHLTFGGVMLVISALLIPQALWGGWSRWRRVLLGLAGALAAYGAFASFGRSIWLGLMVGSLLLACLKLGRRAWVLMVPLALGLAVLVTIQQSPNLQERLREYRFGNRLVNGLSQEANADRLLMWRAGRQAVQENFWFGLGPNQGPQLQTYYDQVHQETGHKFYHIAETGVHNIYLQTLVDFGVLGFCFLMTWWIWVFWASWRAWVELVDPLERALALSVMVGLAAVWTAGFFENNFRDGEVQAAILTLHGLGLWLYQHTSNAQAR